MIGARISDELNISSIYSVPACRDREAIYLKPGTLTGPSVYPHSVINMQLGPLSSVSQNLFKNILFGTNHWDLLLDSIFSPLQIFHSSNPSFLFDILWQE